MSKNTIQFQSAIKKVTTKSDNTLEITLNTQELPIEQMAQMFTLKNSHCAVAIAPYGEEVEPFDPATIDAPKDKSPSNRLRNVLFRVWERDNQGYIDFNSWYLVKMNEIIQHYKGKLD